MVQSALIAVAIMIGLGTVLASVLAWAGTRLYVYEDPRIGRVEEMLPGANCGACGEPGCRAFAERVVGGDATPGGCTVSSEGERTEIASYLGVDVGAGERWVARLACAGGTNVARQRASYLGLGTCRAATLVAGGGKGCAWACLGFGDCEVVCDFDAITMDAHGLPVVDVDRCTACNDCVEICPRDLFSLQPVSRRLWVSCSNRLFGEEAENECEVACTACGLCAADAAENVIAMVENLAIVDYDYNDLASPEAIDRCPTGAIVWLTDDGPPVKGRKAKRIVRRSPLPVG